MGLVPPDRRLIDRLGIAAPIILAPMAGAGGVALAIGAMRGGAVGSLPCAMIDPETVLAQVAEVRAAVSGPINLNFFCHEPPGAYDDAGWRRLLQPFSDEMDVAQPSTPPPPRQPFDAAMAERIETSRPEVVSFHFGLPAEPLLARVRDMGALILGNATSPAEGRWLAERGIDAVIAQGFEAGGHAGRFLPADPSSHTGTIALVPQLCDAIDLPIVAAGGIADARGVAAAFALGAAAVQVGTAYLACPESLISPLHRERLASARAERTVVTNLFSGRPARGFANGLVEALGPTRPEVPPFPHGGDALAELRQADPSRFANMWMGQAARLARPQSAEDLTRALAG